MPAGAQAQCLRIKQPQDLPGRTKCWKKSTARPLLSLQKRAPAATSILNLQAPELWAGAQPPFAAGDLKPCLTAALETNTDASPHPDGCIQCSPKAQSTWVPTRGGGAKSRRGAQKWLRSRQGLSRPGCRPQAPWTNTEHSASGPETTRKLVSKNNNNLPCYSRTFTQNLGDQF